MKKENKLNIKKITYTRLKNLGDYENERIEISLDVKGTDSPEEILSQAKNWVKKQLGKKKKDDSYSWE